MTQKSYLSPYFNDLSSDLMTLVGRGCFVTLVANCQLLTALIAIHIKLGCCQLY